MKNKLKEIRVKNGFTQRKLGEILKISETQIRNYENNRSSPSLITALKIAKILNVKVDEIFQLEGFE